MIRVLHFADLVNRYDFIDTIIRNANPSKFQMMVCTLSDTSNIISPDYQEAGICHWVLNGSRRSDYPVIGLKLAQLLEREKIDLIHTHHYDQGLIGWLATRLYPKTRLILGRHYSDSIYRLTNGWKQKALLGLEQLVNHAATRIIVPSTYISDILTKWQKITSDKVDVIPYGFEPKKYIEPLLEDVQNFREELGFNGRLVIGTFGRLHEEKGHRFLLEALALLKPRYPDLTLVIVGEGIERSALEKQIQTAGLQDIVQLLGWRRDAMRWMAAVDIVVQPTLQEAFSQVMIEALWMKKPLVIADVSGASDIICHGENGLLVPKGNALAIADAIERLINNYKLCQYLAEKGHSLVTNKLTIGNIIPFVEKSYLTALK